MTVKARISEGEIKIYNEIPSQFRGVTGNYIGGFHLVSEDILKEEGFFDVVDVLFDRFLEVLSPLYFDEEKKVFTYKIEQRTDLPTIEQAKIDKISELKKNAREKFNETDWYYVRELRMKSMGKNKNVPFEVIQENEYLYGILDEKEAAINSMVDIASVLKFNAVIDKKEDKKEILPEKQIVEKESIPSELTPSQLLENAKNIERALRSSDYVDYSTVTAALALAESTDEEKTIKANAINDAIRNLVSLKSETDLSAYDVALLSVKEGDYTTESWNEYKLSLEENIVTEANTQQEVDIATNNIKNAQKRLVVLGKDSAVSSPEGTTQTPSSNTTPASEPVVETTPAPQATETLPTPEPPQSSEPVVTPEPAPASEPSTAPAEEPATQPETVAEKAPTAPPTSA